MLRLFLLPAPVQALLATLVTYLFTMMGAALVLLIRRQHPTLMDALLALGAGIMLASSFWSLLAPGIDLAQTLSQPAWLIASCGFLCGSAFLQLGDQLVERLTHAERLNDHTRRVRMLIVSITLHNIPEGLAVGVAFGAFAVAPGNAVIRSAWMLALGIALQNFPEGAAVSLPLLREGFSKRHAFRMGHLSGLVEPIAGLLGALLAASVRQLLPFLLCFAGGAMILVVISELVPECCRSAHPRLMTLVLLLGFAFMMVLDVTFG